MSSSCFKCGNRGATRRERSRSTSPEHLRGKIALCDTCFDPTPVRRGNPEYWKFLRTCVIPAGV